MVATEVAFKAEEPDDKPEPLKMEHFYFPLGLWLVGILLSAFCLLAEISIHRLRKSETDIPMARLEEPDVTQSTELENGNNSDVEDLEDTKL